MKNCAIGIDLGGTKIEVAIVDSDGQIIDSMRTPTGTNESADAVIPHIIDLVRQLLAKNKNIPIKAMGIGVAGQIDKGTGTVIYAPNLQWHNVPLQEKLSSALDCSVLVSNDVKAAVYGEWQFGAGKGCSDLVCVFVGTGVGGGIVDNNEIMHGYHNTAGEIGHMTIDFHGPVCHCGNKGCLEAFAGGWAIERDAKDAVNNDKIAGKIMLELAGGNVAAITGEVVNKALQQEDKLARSIMNNAGDALVAGAISIVNALGPQKMVWGGGIIEGMPQLIDKIKDGVQQYALKAASKDLEILPAKLHNNSVVIGAAMLSLTPQENYKS